MTFFEISYQKVQDLSRNMSKLHQELQHLTQMTLDQSNSGSASNLQPNLVKNAAVA